MLFFFQAEDGIRDVAVTGVQTCALPIWVMELAKPFRMSQPAISKHLKVLERAGLIVRSRRAQSRPCRLEARPLREVADWTERYRRYWATSFDRLDAYLARLRRQERRDGPKDPSE